MRIKVLAEDTSSNSSMKSEHGLSLYIETMGKKILFDTGASNLFLENAEKMGISIKDVDLAVISHGHYDHGGGLRGFFEENDKAKVYIHKKAFEPHFSKRSEKTAAYHTERIRHPQKGGSHRVGDHADQNQNRN